MGLWGNKKDDDPEDRQVVSNGDSSDSVSQPRPSETNERTRLLPPPSAGGREGFLSPDDPGVRESPISTGTKNQADRGGRYHRTISGVCGFYITSLSFSPS
jgi:hypothetical protein